MSHNQENVPPGSPPESQQLARIIHCLVEAESELQAYRSAQPDNSQTETANSNLIQEFSTHLQSAIDKIIHLDSTARKDSRDTSNAGGRKQEEDSFSPDYLISLRKRAEQTRTGEPTRLEGLSKEDIQHAIHELEVHQVELKMQNDELLRVQLELEASRDRFSNLFELAPVGYCILDPKGRLLEANSTLCHLLGVSKSELLHTPIQHYIQAEDQDLFYLYQKVILKNEAGRICEIRMVKKGGERFFAQLESRFVQDQGEQVWVVVSDISSLKRAEETASRYEAVAAAHAELKIEKDRYQDLFDFAPDGYFVTDETGTILEVNQAGAGLLRIPKQGLVGALLVNFVLAEEKFDFQSQVKAILTTKAADPNLHFGEWEFQMTPAGGEPITAAITAVILHEQPDSQLHIRWLVRDVTSRKQTEAELGKNVARFRALFEESSLGIRLLDLQGNTITSNEAMQEILGYSEDELRQIPFTGLTDPLDLERDEGYFRSVLSGEIDRYTIEKRCARKDGEMAWVHQVVFRVRDAANAPSFIVAMTENISERKQMENELAEIRRLLIDSPEAERLMLSQELHDGPMQDLYGVFYNIKILEGKLTGADEEILSGCANTISQVINLLRGFAGQLRPPTLKSFGLKRTICSHAEQFQQDHPEITISLDLTPDKLNLPERVSLALFRIYQQSLANTLRHAQATRIDIRLITNDQHLQLEIKDNGKGFVVPSRLVDLIRNGHLGLVGASERAEVIGGTLTVDSKPGNGTRILVDVNLSMALR